MTTFLLFLSFILNIIAIFAVIILYLRQNRFFQAEERQAKMMKELEELISTYMLEMKEENEDFIKKFLKQKASQENTERHKEFSYKQQNQGRETAPSIHLMEESKELIEVQNDEMDKFEFAPRIEKAVAYQAVKAYQQNTSPKIKEQHEKDWVPGEKFMEDEIRMEIDHHSVHQDIQENNKKEKEDKDNLYMKSLYNQALLLKKQGYSEEDIARKLNKGKTEIELLLKLYQIN